MTDRPILVRCDRGRGYHRWETVKGTMSTPEHPYTERRCIRCRRYESEVR